MQGDYYSEIFSYMQLRLYKCKNSTDPNAQVCQDQSVIDSFFTSTTLSIPMVNSYVDFSDFQIRNMDDLQDVENVGVVKQFIDDRYFFDVEPTR